MSLKNLKGMSLVLSACTLLGMVCLTGCKPKLTTGVIIQTSAMAGDISENTSVLKHDTQKLIALSLYDDDSQADVTDTVSWVSSDTSVALIQANGLVLGVSEGSAVITASLEVPESELPLTSEITIEVAAFGYDTATAEQVVSSYYDLVYSNSESFFDLFETDAALNAPRNVRAMGLDEIRLYYDKVLIDFQNPEDTIIKSFSFGNHVAVFRELSGLTQESEPVAFTIIDYFEVVDGKIVSLKVHYDSLSMPDTLKCAPCDNPEYPLEGCDPVDPASLAILPASYHIDWNAPGAPESVYAITEALEKYYFIVNSQRLGMLCQIFHGDVVFNGPFNYHSENLGGLFVFFMFVGAMGGPDRVDIPLDIYISGNSVVVYLLGASTFMSTPFAVEAIDWFEFVDGKIEKLDILFDVAGMDRFIIDGVCLF